MAQYSKATDASGTTRYKDGNKFVKADNVPENIKEILNNQADGIQVDELGDTVNPETDLDDSTDESAPAPDEDADEDETDEDKTPAKPAKAAPEQQPVLPGATPESEEHRGMGFKLVKGKTVDIFDYKTPATHSKFVAGVVVPLSEDSYDNKTDQEIITRLDELRKQKKTHL